MLGEVDRTLVLKAVTRWKLGEIMTELEQVKVPTLEGEQLRLGALKLLASAAVMIASMETFHMLPGESKKNTIAGMILELGQVIHGLPL